MDGHCMHLILKRRSTRIRNSLRIEQKNICVRSIRLQFYMKSILSRFAVATYLRLCGFTGQQCFKLLLFYVSSVSVLTSPSSLVFLLTGWWENAFLLSSRLSILNIRSMRVCVAFVPLFFCFIFCDCVSPDTQGYLCRLFLCVLVNVFNVLWIFIICQSVRVNYTAHSLIVSHLDIKLIRLTFNGDVECVKKSLTIVFVLVTKTFES